MTPTPNPSTGPKPALCPVPCSQTKPTQGPSGTPKPGTLGVSTLPTTSGGSVTPTNGPNGPNGPTSGPGGATTVTSPGGGGVTPSQGLKPSGTKPTVATTGQPGGGGGGKTINIYSVLWKDID